MLIVDAHDDTRAMYVDGLSELGFEVLCASDASEAFAVALDKLPEVVVSELAFHASDGWEFHQRMKADSRTRDIPVIALTGYAVASYRERANREGFAAFLEKPCLADQLGRRIEIVLRRRA